MKQQDHFAKCRDQILRPFAQNLDPPGEAEECNPPIVGAHLLLPLLEYGETPLQTASPVALPQSPCRGVLSRYPRNMMIMTFLSLQEFYQHHLVQGLCHR